jgi:hypothetical protein
MSSNDIDAQIAQTLAKIHEHSAVALAAEGVDELKMKEVRLRGLQEVEKVMANDQKASIVSVVVYVAVT